MRKQYATDWEQEAFEKGAQIITDLGNLSNTGCGRRAAVDGMLDAFVREHRTLQQSIVRNFVGMLTQWSEGQENAMSDLRNQAAWEFAGKLQDIAPGFPLI